MLLKRRPPPVADGGGSGKSTAEAGSHLVLGTLSAIVGHPINGYLPIPDWCSVQPDGSAREPPKEEPRALAPIARSSAGKGNGGQGNSEFYSGSGSGSESESESDSGSGSSPYSSEDGSESDSYDSASTSGGEEESGSESSDSENSGSGSEESSDDEDDDSDSSVGSSSYSSSGDDSESSGTKGEEGVGLLIMGPGSSTSSAAATTYGASAAAPHTQDLTGLVERMSVADREDSASPRLGVAAGAGLASLSTAGIRGPGAPALGVAGTIPLGRTSSTSSVLSADPEGDTSASFPATLLRHQAGGGLQVDYRFSRGRASALSRPSTTLTLRLSFTNHGETPVRRIRVVAPRDGTPMEAFPEIQMLPAGGAQTSNLGIDFGGKAKDVSGG